MAERDIWVMGVPVSLSHTKYPRNALLFNLAFVVDGKFDCLEEYFSSIEQALMKLSGYLTTLERESEYLFRHGSFDSPHASGSTPSHAATPPVPTMSASSVTSLSLSLPISIGDDSEMEGKLPLPQVVIALFEAINARLAATVNVGPGNTMYLKLYPNRSEPPAVLLHQVPVPVLSINFTVDALAGIMSMWSPARYAAAGDSSAHSSSSDDARAAHTPRSDSDSHLSKAQFSFQEEWDLALRRVIPFVDGVSHVKKICQAAAMEPPAVSKALQHLLYYGCIRMLDIFQFSNIYIVLPTLRDLYSNTILQRACLQTVAINPAEPVDFQSVFSTYAQFQPDTIVKTIVLRSRLEELNIDIRALIQFGLLNGLIRRIHKYPVSIASNSSTITSSSISNVHQMVDGKHSYDEIAVTHDLPFSELDKHFDLSLYR